MTETLRQSLSAAMDDEADAFELRRVLDELGRDAELRSLWDRYHLIGCALRGEPIDTSDELRERVWQALELETDAAPAEDPVDAPQVLPAAGAAAAAGSGGGSWLGRYTGLAVAASVAFAVVVGLNGMWGADDAPAQLAGNADGAAPLVSAQAGAATAVPELRAPQVNLATEVSPSDVQRAQAYMLHHTQQQALNQAGVMSFVKLATYEAP